MGCISAQAASTASASLSNVRIQLIDLDPFDGITSAISFDDTLLNSYNQITVNGNPQQTYWTGGPLGTSFGPFTSGTGSTWARLQVFAGDLLAGSGPGASAFATAAGTGNSAASVSESLALGFTLTPHTRIVMTADATEATISGGLGESGFAQNILGLLHLSPDGSTTGETDVTYSFLTTDGLTYTAAPRVLQVTFENMTGSPMDGYAMAYAAAMAYGVAAVPEPQSIALLLTGLAAIGFTVRRRKVN